MCLKNAAIIVQ